MAARPDRVARGRRHRARVATDRCLAGAVCHLSDPRMARRRGGGRPARRRGGGGDRRLVVRLRLFPRRPLLGRQCVSDRCQDLRLAVAVRGHRPAGRNGHLHRTGACARAADLDARRNPLAGAGGGAHHCRVAARSLVRRVSVEHVRLRADIAALAGAGCRTRRDLGPDLRRGRGLCEPCGSRR